MTSVRTKVCAKCGETKDLTRFNKRSKAKDGHVSYCKACVSKYEKARYAGDSDRIKANAKSYYRANPEKARKYQKKYRADTASYRRNYMLQRNYGLTLACYEKIWQAQNCKCDICKREREENKPHFPVDHCHETGKIRAILCDRCNRALGLMQDDPDVIQSASEYLRKHKEQ